MAFLNQGISKHVSDPNISTACTTATWNPPTVILFAPSLPKILSNRTHLTRAIRRLCSTAGQLLSEDDNFCPRYLNEVNAGRGVPYFEKTLPIRSSFSSTNILYHFLPSRVSISLKSGAPYWVRPVGKKCHTGGNGGGIDSPTPGLLCCPEGVGGKSEPGGLSMMTLTPGTTPQGIPMGQGWQESTLQILF